MFFHRRRVERASWRATPVAGTADAAVSSAPPAAPLSDREPRASLHELAGAVPWPAGLPERALLDVLDEKLTPSPQAKVAVIGGASARPLAELLERAHPRVQVRWVAAQSDPSALHVALCVANPYNLIVDVDVHLSGTAAQVDLFRRTFMHLGRDGSYLVQRVAQEEVTPADTTEGPATRGSGHDLAAVLRLAAETPFDRHAPAPVRDLFSLGRNVGEVRRVGPGLLVRNTRRLRPKLRDDQVNAVLEARPELGELLDTWPGVSFASRCDYEDSAPFSDDPVERQFSDVLRPTVFDAPPLYLRRYDRPVCGRGQIVESQGLILPDTYRHQGQPRLVNMYVNDTAPLFGEVRTPVGSPLPLPGAYFQFDSEWPGHFGHTTTEQISRLWSFRRAREIEPDLKLLTTLPKSREDQRLQPWELALLQPYGVTAEDVVIFDAAVRPERLYAATPMFSCPYYVHPAISRTWDHIGRALTARADRQARPRRIFCSRRRELKRACRNTPEVERFFEAWGFTVVYPEEHPMAEQVALFRAAEVIAGFGGSGLFTMAFCETPKTVITIAPSSYTPGNEYLFASVRGHRLRSAWCRPDVAHPPGGWSVEAFGSSFAVDFAREGRYLRHVLDGLDS